ncbi:MAG: NADH-quinone oxidoreductase subunit NuoE [Spirochaetaceae bacterium]
MPAEVQPTHPDFTIDELDRIIHAHREEAGALIPVLQEVQESIGYLPKEALMHIAARLDIPYSEVAGVVSFYSFFTTIPRGRHTVRTCLGTACYVRGGKDVLESLKRHLGIEVGGTTEDRMFSLEIGRCFGACGLAPVVVVDEDVHQQVKPSRVSELLTPYRDEEESA